jgi:hypothetical protein
LRHEQITRHGLEDYPQWVDNLLGSGQVSAEEADILLQARSATARVIRVDDFTPEQMTNKSGVAKPAESSKKAVKKKAVNKKSVANKKRVRGAA